MTEDQQQPARRAERPERPERPGLLEQADVAPLDVDGVRTITVGTAVWAVAFLVLLPFYGWLEDAGHLWWLWTCLTAVGLGLLGIVYTRWRRARIRRSGEGS